MGKRKLCESELDDYIERKLEKLSRKIRKRAGEQDLSRNKETPGLSSYYDSDIPTAREYCDSNGSTSEEPVPLTGDLNITDTAENTIQQQEQTPIEPPPAPELDSEILNILGDDPSKVIEYGKEIQTDLAVRFQHIATNGLPKETRKELQGLYLPPSNCTNIDAPILNLEIRAAVSDIVLKRDKGIELKQKELCSAISCIGEALTLLISKGEKDASLIKLLMDAARLMCDCQNTDSITRRNFVLYNVKKEMKEQLQKTKIDKNLFGSDLADTLKTAKLISKSGAELKSAPVPANNSNSRNKYLPGQSTQQPRNNLNWKAPPLNRRQRGTQRTREPAQRSRHTHNSRSSYHRGHPSSRSRH